MTIYCRLRKWHFWATIYMICSAFFEPCRTITWGNLRGMPRSHQCFTAGAPMWVMAEIPTASSRRVACCPSSTPPFQPSPIRMLKKQQVRWVLLKTLLGSQKEEKVWEHWFDPSILIYPTCIWALIFWIDSSRAYHLITVRCSSQNCDKMDFSTRFKMNFPCGSSEFGQEYLGPFVKNVMVCNMIKLAAKVLLDKDVFLKQLGA